MTPTSPQSPPTAPDAQSEGPAAHNVSNEIGRPHGSAPATPDGGGVFLQAEAGVPDGPRDPATRPGKLVRDRIPDIIRANGEIANVRRVMTHSEHARLLDAKLDEELAEWRECHDPTELADLLEVIRALADMDGIGWRDLIVLMNEKRAERGGFTRGWVWEGNQPGPADDPVDGYHPTLDGPAWDAEARRRVAAADASDGGQ